MRMRVRSVASVKDKTGAIVAEHVTAAVDPLLDPAPPNAVQPQGQMSLTITDAALMGQLLPEMAIDVSWVVVQNPNMTPSFNDQARNVAA